MGPVGPKGDSGDRGDAGVAGKQGRPLNRPFGPLFCTCTSCRTSSPDPALFVSVSGPAGPKGDRGETLIFVYRLAAREQSLNFFEEFSISDQGTKEKLVMQAHSVM